MKRTPLARRTRLRGRLHSTPPPTPEQVRRFEQIRELGCIACRMRGVGYVWPEIHHLTKTGRHGGERRGHDFTVGLCPWHHRGVPMKGIYKWSSEAVAGPSLKETPRKFREEFGQDARLLEYQNQLLERRNGHGSPVRAGPGANAGDDGSRGSGTLLSPERGDPEGV